MAAPVSQLLASDFPQRVAAARKELARTDPEGERDAVAPLPTVFELIERGEWESTIGTRTAADLEYGPAPDPLVPPFLTAEGGTVLYARGGTGKGITACWFVQRLVAAGHVVMVVDYEGHRREWGSRLRGLGMADDHLTRIHYREPYGPDWELPTGQLSKVAPLLRADCDRLGVTYVVVDSYSVATSNGDTMGGEAAAREYFTGMTLIGRPSLTIAHVRGDSGRFPDRPFGSVHVHNLARETWAVEKVGDEPDHDPDLIRHGPRIVNLELRNKKSNTRGTAPAQFVSFSFFDDGSITATTGRPAGRDTVDLIADVLRDGPLTIPRIVAAIKEDTGEVYSEETVGRTLRRHGPRFVAGEGRPKPWALR